MREMAWDGPTTILSERIARGVEITTVFERRGVAQNCYAVRSVLRMEGDQGAMRVVRAYDRVVDTAHAAELVHEHVIAVAIETMRAAEEAMAELRAPTPRDGGQEPY
jgi:hypothetical protein